MYDEYGYTMDSSYRIYNYTGYKRYLSYPMYPKYPVYKLHNYSIRYIPHFRDSRNLKEEDIRPLVIRNEGRKRTFIPKKIFPKQSNRSHIPRSSRQYHSTQRT